MTKSFDTGAAGTICGAEKTLTAKEHELKQINMQEIESKILLNEEYVLKRKGSQESWMTLEDQKVTSPESNKGIESPNKEVVSRDIKKWKTLFLNIYKCPMQYHLNFIGCFLFIWGSFFFYYTSLLTSGYWLFIVACFLILIASVIGVNNSKEILNEYCGYMCYNIGSIVFIWGCVYSLLYSDALSVYGFITGSAFYLIGSIAFFFSIKLTPPKPTDEKIIFVYFINFVGGALFTIGSIFLLYNFLIIQGVTLYFVGSILFTCATFVDYMIFLDTTNVIIL